MNRYIKIKIKYLVIFSITLLLACGLGGYYIWCSYNPDIKIQISASSAGKDLNIEAPHIAIGGIHGIEPAAAINLNITNVWIQHETICSYVKDNYLASNIMLNMETNHDQTILTYYGTATNLRGEDEDFEKIIYLDFVLQADITYR